MICGTRRSEKSTSGTIWATLGRNARRLKSARAAPMTYCTRWRRSAMTSALRAASFRRWDGRSTPHSDTEPAPKPAPRQSLPRRPRTARLRPSHGFTSTRIRKGPMGELSVSRLVLRRLLGFDLRRDRTRVSALRGRGFTSQDFCDLRAPKPAKPASDAALNAVASLSPESRSKALESPGEPREPIAVATEWQRQQPPR